jgi:hypothetical protein
MKQILLIAFVMIINIKTYAIKVHGTATSTKGCKVVVDGDINLLTNQFTGTATVSGPNPPCFNGTMTFSKAAKVNSAVVKFKDKSNALITSIAFNSANLANAGITKTLSEKIVSENLIKIFNSQIKRDIVKQKEVSKK